MMYDTILFEITDGVGRITLNRPEVYNALNNKIKVELKNAFEQLEQDSSVRAIVITGQGAAFCSGQDLKAAQVELAGTTYSDAVRTYYNPLILTMINLTKPIICRLNGVAAGAGCSTRLRLASLRLRRGRPFGPSSPRVAPASPGQAVRR